MEKLPIFQRPLATVNSSDLTELTTMEEGWFVEFKELLPDNTKIAKSICSFANSYGGLLVLGAKEDQKTRRLQCLTGFSEEKAIQAVTQIREAAANHASPSPYFETKILNVPEEDTKESERWVVLVRIPQGSQPPYVHSSGAIYRRIGESASPRVEANSSVIEQFVKDATRKRRQLAERVLKRCSDKKAKSPRCDVVVKLIDDGQILERERITFEQFHAVANRSHNKNSAALYDSVFPHDNSLLARRIEGQLFNRSLLWEYDPHRAFHVAQIPLAAVIWDETHFDLNSTPSAERLQQFEHLLKKMVNRWAIAIDFLPLLFFLCDLLYRIKKLHSLEGYKGKYAFNARLTNVDSCIPFLNTQGFKKQISTYGIPLALRNLDFLRDLEDPSVWLKVESSERVEQEVEPELRLNFEDGIPLFAHVLQSIGITAEASIGEANSSDSLQAHSLAQIFADLMSGSFSFSTIENPST